MCASVGSSMHARCIFAMFQYAAVPIAGDASGGGGADAAARTVFVSVVPLVRSLQTEYCVDAFSVACSLLHQHLQHVHLHPILFAIAVQ